MMRIRIAGVLSDIFGKSGSSRSFYEKLGFQVFGGYESQNWLLMQNGSCTIGLFQGIFEKNMLKFNPGWDEKATRVDPFIDARYIQRHQKHKVLKDRLKQTRIFQVWQVLSLLIPTTIPFLLINTYKTYVSGVASYRSGNSR